MLKGQARIIATEEQEQAALVEWLDFKKIPFFHIPNGGYRNKIEGARFKRLGVRAGVPDICIPLARNGYHGLYIELKRRCGSLVSPPQQHWLTLLNKNGYFAVVALGFDHARRIVEEYFFINGEKNPDI